MADRYATPAGAGLMDGTSWANAYDVAALKASLEGVAAAGDNYWLRGTTFTLTASINTARDGTIALPINVIGVGPTTTAEPPTFANWATGTDRPLIAAGANLFVFDDYWRVCNLRITSTAGYGLRLDWSGIVYNCKVDSASVGWPTSALYNAGPGIRVIDCELTNTSGHGFYTGSGVSVIVGCYIHDCSSRGALIENDNVSVVNSIIADCAVGIDCTNDDYGRVIGCTIYNCPLGIDGTDAGNPFVWVFMNNLIDSCTVGANWGAEIKSNFWDYNNWHANGTDVLNVTKGPHATAVDPQFVDAPGGDFRPTGPNIWGTGFGIRLGVGSPSLPNQGAFQGIPYTAPPAGIDITTDYLVLDGLEDIYLNGAVVQNAYRLPFTLTDEDTEAGYLHSDIVWHLPTVTPITPKPGDVITNAAGDAFNVLSVRKPFLSDTWHCVSREPQIAAGLAPLTDLITLWPAVISVDSFGSRIAKHPDADPAFTDIPAKIQIQPPEMGVFAGKHQFKRIFDIYVARDIDVHISDLLIDQNANQYDITSWENRRRIDELSHVVAEYVD